MGLRTHAGSSLVEALAVMTLSSMVMAVIAGICAAQLRLARAAADRAAATDAVRTATSILLGEARRITPEDIRAHSDDSLALRAFRGAGLPCGTTAGGTLVRHTGDRLPDPAKDSVLILGSEGEVAVQLFDSDRAAGMCPALPGETVLEWRTAGGPVQPGSVLLVFESGAYHLSGRALRYRIGAGGRQPLTEEALRHPYTRFTGFGAASIGFRIQVGERRSEHAAFFAPLPSRP
jgi:hypothetical protein